MTELIWIFLGTIIGLISDKKYGCLAAIAVAFALISFLCKLIY